MERGVKPMQLQHIHPMPILIAALSTFVLGGLWYSPRLFGRVWMRENRFTETELQRGNHAVIFGGSFCFALIMAANLAFFLAAPDTTLGWGAAAGALAGVGWVATSIAVIGLFERKSWTLIGINAGYQIVSFVVMGAILGGWR